MFSWFSTVPSDGVDCRQVLKHVWLECTARRHGSCPVCDGVDCRQVLKHVWLECTTRRRGSCPVCDGVDCRQVSKHVWLECTARRHGLCLVCWQQRFEGNYAAFVSVINSCLAEERLLIESCTAQVSSLVNI